MYTAADVIIVLPEIVMLAMTCIILLVGLYTKKSNYVYLLAQFTLIVVALLTFCLAPSVPALAFGDSVVLDRLAVVLKLFVYLLSFVVFLYSRVYITDRKFPVGEYYVLSLFCVLGMMVLVSGHSLLTLFLGLELVSLPLYALVAIQRDDSSASESGMKYFVMGSIATGLLLYGMSMLYGATQSFDIAEIANRVDELSATPHAILMFGLVFIFAGLIFKLGAVPFHVWVPDVYQGAPSSVTLLISTAPKVAALGMMFRLLVDAMPGLDGQWQQLLIIVTLTSIALGNIAAILQKNIKRMLAYSAIANMGYLMLGVLCGASDGYSAALFYSLTYGLMSLGAFGMVVLMSRLGLEAELIDDFKGLNQRNPWLAFLMLIIMFSMAGIPPTVGFFAKMGVLKALVHADLTWLAVIGLVFAVVGAYYYLYVIKVMYFDDAKQTSSIVISSDAKALISINALALLFLGIFPGQLLTLCESVFPAAQVYFA